MKRVSLPFLFIVLCACVVVLSYTCNKRTGIYKYKCTKSVHMTSTKYRRCGFLWMRRCKRTRRYYKTGYKICYRTCRVNGGWSSWQSWSSYGSCSVTCDGYGKQKYVRKRYCNNPVPRNGGRHCSGESHQNKFLYCRNNRKCPPVNGGWSSWGPLVKHGACSVTCENGVQKYKQERSCTNPAPQHNGRHCMGNRYKYSSATCYTHRKCPVDGGWTPWSKWVKYGSCSVTCGNGVQKYKKTRTCTNPVPKYGGKLCSGKSYKYRSRTCRKMKCPSPWPRGVYALIKPRSGCPVNWKEGWRFQDNEDNQNANQITSGHQFYGIFERDILFFYCTKDRSLKKGTGNWPKGSYCILRSGSSCPKGFRYGSIFWDDEDTGNGNDKNGVLPSGKFNADTKINYCCRKDSSHRRPISLPNKKPFYLLRYKSQCQKVKGMSAKVEIVKTDDEDRDNRNWQRGNHPDNNGGKDNKLYYCYYSPL